MFRSLWHRWMQRQPRSATKRRGARQKRRPRPLVELLEDRTLLSAVLVKDLNPNEQGSSPSQMVELNGSLIFFASDGINGTELWRSDGSANGTVLLKDINPGAASSFQGFFGSQLVRVGNTVFFTADNGTNGPELWKTNGTATGTVLVKDIFPGVSFGNDAPSNLVRGPDLTTLFFTAGDGTNGVELWKSDGTANGTVLVKDILPGLAGSFPFSLTADVRNGLLYFTATNGVNGAELWKSDGTTTGTVLVKDIRSGSSSSNPFNLTDVDGTLFFEANDGVNGEELWKSNGTANGTVLVKDINGGANASVPSSLTNFLNLLFFAANGGTNASGLWRSDGTANNTVLLKSFLTFGSGSPEVSNLTVVGTTMYFSANDGANGEELWKTDGTANGTVLVKNIQPGTVSSDPFGLTNVNGTLFFLAGTPGSGIELWKSDGSSNGTVLVKDVNPGPRDSVSSFFNVSMANLNGNLLFAATSGLLGNELWKSDGSANGTALLKNINLQPEGSQPGQLTNVNGTLMFRAADLDNGDELWKSTGVAAGTVLVRDIFAGQSGSFPDDFVNVNGTLYFVAFGSTSGGIGLWKSDGTTAGTVLIREFLGNFGFNSVRELTNVNGTLFFVANDGATGDELWKSDGSSTGTVPVKDIRPGLSGAFDFAPALVNANGTLFFLADDGVNGKELWKSDGTLNGTALVKDLRPGAPSAFGFNPKLVDVNGTVFFSADDGVNGEELWKSNGTTAGTVLVKDIFTGTSLNSSFPDSLVNVNGTLFFSAFDLTTGTELWKSDGTMNGTVLVKDIAQPFGSSFPHNLAKVGNRVFFAADDGTSGTELWASDGSAFGTTLVKDINPGNASAFGFNDELIIDSFGTAFFVADDGVHGRELWSSNGTPAGTVLVQDINPNAASAFPSFFSDTKYLAEVNGTVFFAAEDPSFGTEIWKTVSPTAPPGTLQFTLANYSAEEDAGTVTITVTRGGGSAGQVTVNFAASPNSATNLDFTPTSGTLTFADGELSKTFTVAITEDLSAEPPETVNLALSTPTGGAALGTPNTATLTIVDNDNPGTLHFSTSAFTAFEFAGTVTITVTRSAGTLGTVTVDFATANGTATAGSDYAAASGTLTFLQGEKTKTFFISILQDTVVDVNETVNLTLTNPTGGATLGTPNPAVLTIIDDERPGILSFTSPAFAVNETAGNALITVIRTSGSDGTVTIDFATANGTATAGSDYTATSGTLTFTAGQTSQTFTIPIINDTAIELPPPETVNLTLSNPGGGATLGFTPTAVLEITDDDAKLGRFQFSAANYGVPEDAGTLTVTINRANGSDGAVTVFFSTSSGTAQSSIDFFPVSQTVSFANGETSKTVTVSIINDTIVEINETFNLSLTNPTSGATLGTPSTAVVTIIDDDTRPGQLNFSAPIFNVSENSGSATINVTRTDGSAGQVTVQFATTTGTATAGTDYTATSGTLTFANGEVSKSFTIPILTDTAFNEGIELVNLALSNPTGGAILGVVNTSVLAISDLDIGRFAFDMPSYTVAENAGSATITVRRMDGFQGTITVDFATSDGTAAAGLDYTATSGTLTFTPFDFSKSFTVPILPDNAFNEGIETVNLRLSNPGGGAGLSIPVTAVLTINELDAGQFSLASNTSFTVLENAGSIEIQVVRSGGFSGTALVNFATSNGTATAGGDYTATSGTLTFLSFENFKTFTIPILVDATPDEGIETINVALSNPTGGAALGIPSKALVQISDNVGYFQVAQVNYTVIENNGQVIVGVSRVGGFSGQATVDFATGGGTATAGTDYTSQSGTLTFADGETTKDITVAILVDTTNDEGIETFSVTLSNPGGGASLSALNRAMVSISDTDIGNFVVTPGLFGVAENGGQVVVSIARQGGSNGRVTVDFATSDGSATAGTDYTPASGTLTFNTGETVQNVTIPILDDTAQETDEVFNLALSNPTGGAALGVPSRTLIEINEDESSQPLMGAYFQFSATHYTVRENEGFVTLTVFRLGDTSGGVAVYYDTLTTGTATPNADFTSATFVLVNFAPGETQQTFTIPILLDNLANEGAETINVQLNTPIGGTIAAPDTAVVTITDYEIGQFSFSAPSYSVAENGGSVTITVQRNGGTSGQATVGFATSDGSATDGADYTLTTGTLTFANGESTKSFTIPILVDANPNEGPETINLLLLNPGLGAATTIPVKAVVVINDNDIGQFSIANDGASVLENAGFITITVNRSNGSAGQATVDFTTIDGTATAGSDYTATSGTLTFLNGETSKSFTIPILVDGNPNEGPETINIRLSGPTGGAGLTPPKNGLVTITDFDIGQIVFSLVTYTVSENGGSATIDVSRVGGSTGQVTVNFATANGTAIAGSDYTATTGTLTFAASETFKSFTIPILLDSIPNEGIETINLALSSPTGGAALGVPSAAVVLINDVGIGQFVFSPASLTVLEDGIAAVISVIRQNGSMGQATVNFATSNGTATAGSDYTARSGTLTFADFESFKSFTIPILADNIYEGVETVNLTLSNPTGGAGLSLPSTGVLLIDDFALGQVQFSRTVYNVAENGSSVTITLNRVNGFQGMLVVNYATSDGTATAGGDYTATSGSLTFNTFEFTKSFTIPILDDGAGEASETVNLSLSLTSGVGSLGVPATALLNIVDNDNALVGQLEFSSTSYGANETGGSVLVTVNRVGGSTGTVTVNFATSNGTATAGSDYTASSGTLTFADGETSKSFTIPILDDTTAEQDETINLSLSIGIGGATLGNNSTAVVTIVDNDGPGKLQFSSPFYVVTENGGSATITVTRTAGGVGQVTVSFATTTGGTATAGTDFTAITGTLTWADGETGNKTFNIAITNDTDVEGDESVNLTLTGPSGGATLGAIDAATLTITDDDFNLPGQLQFTSFNYVVTEGGGSATITVSRTGGTNGQVSVTATTSNGSATSGSDYTLTSINLTWANGETGNKAFTIPITQDTLIEGDETINLTLGNATGGASLGLNTAFLTITDDDFPQAGQLQFSLANYSVAENVASVTITVTRTGGSDGQVTVGFISSDGSATAGSDYTGASGTLTFNQGETSKSFTVAIIDDMVFEGNETVNLALTSTTGGATLGTPNLAVLTINDNEVPQPGVLAFSQATYTVAENTPSITITVTRTGGSDGQVTVSFAAASGTATAGSDFTGTNGTLTFNNGETTSKTFTVAILDDTLFEGDETVNLTLSNAGGGATIGSPNPAVLTITENDVAQNGQLQFSQATYTVGENGGSLTITVNRVGGTDGQVTVTFATGGGTATAGQDYTATSGSLTWANAVTGAKTFTIPILDDTVIEGNETVNLTLSNPTGGAVLGSPQTAVVTITDFEAGQLQFSAGTYAVAENAGNIIIVVTRINGSDGQATVQFATSNGTATAPQDYTAASGTLNFGTGETSKSFTISIIDDSAVEGNETVNLTLTNPTGATLGSISNAGLTITDFEAGQLQLSASTYTVAENGANVVITVTRTGGSDGQATVQFATSNGSATAGQDYTATTTTLTFATGDTSKSVTIPILDDNALEGNETVNLALSNIAGANLGTPNTALLTITDVEAGQLQFSSATYSAAENVASIVITVNRANGSDGQATVQFATSNGTATAGQDYTATSGTLTFATGETSRIFTVAILDDTAVEGNETVNLALTNASGAMLGTPNTSVLTISDFEPGQFQFSSATYTVAENAGTVIITVTRTGGTNGQAGVTYSAGGGTATAGQDYTAVTAPFTWNDGEGGSKSYPIAIINDNVFEGDETVNLTLSNATGGAQLGTPSTAVLTITDDDPVPPTQVQFNPTAYTVNEVSGAVVLTITRTGGSVGQATVHFATGGGTATAGPDYTASTGTLTFADGDTSKTVTIAVLDDQVVDDSETLNVTLSAPTGTSLGTNVTATVTLVDSREVGDNERFVRGLYHDVLGRGAKSTDSVGPFTGSLTTAREPVLKPVILDFVAGPENRAKLVISYFVNFLRRSPAPDRFSGDVSFWVGQLNNGDTPEHITEVFIGTDEYFQKAQSLGSTSPTPEGKWLDRAYLDILGRSRAANETFFLSRTLNTPAARTQVIHEIINGAFPNEYQRKVINDVYMVHLGRPAMTFPTFDEFGFWIPQLTPPKGTLNQPNTQELFVANVIGSQEYFKNVGNVVTLWVETLYTRILGRPAEQAGLDFHTDRVLNSYAQNRKDLARSVFLVSPEYRRGLIALDFQQYLGHGVGPTDDITFFLNRFQAGDTAEQVQALFLTSQEYLNRAGVTGTIATAAYLDRLYLDVLGRARQANETFFLNKSQQAAAAGLLASTEYRGVLIRSQFQTYLRRAATSGDVDFWVQVFNGGGRDEDLAASLLTAREYFLRKHQVP